MIAFTFLSITPLTHTQAITTLPWHFLTVRRPHFCSSTKESTQRLKNASSKLIHATHWFELVLFPPAPAAFRSRGHGLEGEGGNRRRRNQKDKSRDVKGGEVMGWVLPAQAPHHWVKNQSGMEENMWISSEGKKRKHESMKEQKKKKRSWREATRSSSPSWLPSDTFRELNLRLEMSSGKYPAIIKPCQGAERMDPPLASLRGDIESHQVFRKNTHKASVLFHTVNSLHLERSEGSRKKDLCPCTVSVRLQIN